MWNIENIGNPWISGCKYMNLKGNAECQTEGIFNNYISPVIFITEIRKHSVYCWLAAKY